jgi:hypothetical protein
MVRLVTLVNYTDAHHVKMPKVCAIVQARIEVEVCMRSSIFLPLTVGGAGCCSWHCRQGRRGMFKLVGGSQTSHHHQAVEIHVVITRCSVTTSGKATSRATDLLCKQLVFALADPLAPGYTFLWLRRLVTDLMSWEGVLCLPLGASFASMATAGARVGAGARPARSMPGAATHCQQQQQPSWRSCAHARCHRLPVLFAKDWRADTSSSGSGTRQ